MPTSVGGDARDHALVTGVERFTADIDPSGALHLVFVRSPHASARLRAIDTSVAAQAPGVVAVLTAADLDLPPIWEIAMIDERFAQPPLAVDRVRHVGERVVAVVADTLAHALDGCELVVVDYDVGTAIVDAAAAMSPVAPALFEHAPGNVCLEWPSDSPGATFPGATRSVRVANHLPRLSVAPLEGHSCLAHPEVDDSVTVWVSTQVPTSAHRQLARALRLPLDRVRVITPAVGGGFGGKAAGGLPDQILTAAVARHLGAPVRFVEDRASNLALMQGRGVDNRVTLHADDDGRVLGLTADITVDAGAYPTVGAVEPGKTRLMLAGPYRQRTIDVSARAVVTNLPPVGAYRGPGRSEAAQMIERALDVLAADVALDPLEIRRRNVLRADELPYLSPTGVEYDSGDFPHLLDVLERESGYAELRARQAAMRATDGPRLGIGIAFVLDSTAWFARTERAHVEVGVDGRVLVATGSSPAGQRLDRLLRDIVVSVLPVAADDVDVIEGDTARVDAYDGTMGSRSAQMAGGAVLRSCEDLFEQVRALAAEQLECAPDDVVRYGTAGLGVLGTPASVIPLAQLAASAPEPVEASCVHEQSAATYPAAAHLSVVELDPETGLVVPIRHVAVTDCGRVLDRASATGQIVGATVQGIAQALSEAAVFDDFGTPLNSSFAEYGIFSAAEAPRVECHFVETPSARNPMGAKGVGEIGMVAAPVAVQNAVLDALHPFGVRHLDLPCTPQAVWSAIRATR